MADKLKECVPAIRCHKSFQGCFNNSLRCEGQCEKCLHLLLKEHDEIVRQEFIDEMKSRFFHQVGTQFDNAILEMEKLAEHLSQ